MKKKILVIEDDKFLAELLTKKIVEEGFNATYASNGQEAMEKIKTTFPDLIFLDLLLPDSSGFELLSKIKEDSEISSIPVVILSNLSQGEDIDRGLKLGAVDYLIKSQLNMNEIVDKAKQIFEKK